MQLSQAAILVLQKRYLGKNHQGKIVETPEEMFSRVARTISGAEYEESAAEYEEQFYKIMTNLEFLPNSPTLINAGRELGQLSACFVLPIDDSMHSIFTTLRDAAIIQKSGGGVGFNFSNIRPHNDNVKTTHKCAGGPIEFIKIYDRAIEPISQGGVRRGANMALLRCDHPDIIEFIRCKEVEGTIPNFNISVSITDDFISAVRNNRTFELINPRSGEITQTVRATELFDEIIQHAWNNGEPGVVFIDEMNRHNVVPHIGEIEATNPCVTGDTLIATDWGLERFIDFVGRGRKDATTMIENGEYFSAIKYFNNGIQPIYKVTTKSGYSLRVTKDHKFIIDGSKVPVRTDKLKIGDNVILNKHVASFVGRPDNPVNTIEAGELLGWLVGDGYISNSTINNKAGIILGKYDINLLDILQSFIKSVVGNEISVYHRPQFNTHQLISRKLWTWAVKVTGVSPAMAQYKSVPENIFTAKEEVVKAFLRGIFSADGHVRLDKKRGGKGKSCSIVLNSKSKKLVEEIQILFSAFGLRTTILNRSRKPRMVRFRESESEYLCDGILYELFLHGDARKFFVEEIGFTLGSHKYKKLEVIAKTNFNDPYTGYGHKDAIISIEPDGDEEVFDFTVDHPNRLMVSNGLITVECGEQPLLGYESCNLGSINLGRFVKAGKIDFERLQYVVHTAVRFLDNVIDMNKYPLPQVEARTKTTRKIGLGVMGFADFLIKMNIKYDTEEAVKMAHTIMKFIHDNAIVASSELAKTRGVFPAYRGSTWCTERGIKLRNACLTTIAPTGTLSIIANCSSGIEPYYSKSTKKHVLETILDENVEFAKEDSFITSHEVAAEWHIKIQAAFQAHSDSAVSKTINFPNSATIEDVKHAYMLAYKLKCKGLTIYRDQSRKKQVLVADQQHDTKKTENDSCPQCKEALIHEDGCVKCSKCDWSACKVG